MQFVLDHEKAAQAAALLLQRHRGRLNYTALIKLLYMADRRSFVESGLPITGDYMVSMKNGTVLSGVYDLIKGEKEHPAWDAHIKRDGYDVALLKVPTFRRLSSYEKRVIENIDAEFGHLDWRVLCDLTHQFPEWHNPDDSSERIEPADILRREHKNDDEIERIAREAEEFFFLKTA
ncbi:MAG: Panacea domain-containing protein [Candidatus Binataceae bacterium]|jgi:uncharacterized phage-associated protein